LWHWSRSGHRCRDEIEAGTHAVTCQSPSTDEGVSIPKMTTMTLAGGRSARVRKDHFPSGLLFSFSVPATRCDRVRGAGSCFR
jgi:hypothetical protein